MATVVYLDVEDEITSAAARIRTARETRVALVLPFGSRLATSRINFRLLSREAMLNGKRLDIVAPDASGRALAASAGLPVFTSVGEWEAAVAAGDAPEPGTGGGAAGAAAAALGGAAVVAGAAGAGMGAAGAMGPAAGATTQPAGPSVPVAGVDERRPNANPPVVHGKRRSRVRPAAVAGVGLLAIALLVAGVAAWLLLPSAEIAIAPRLETIGPINLDVRADPNATEVDVEAAVIPATEITIPVRASGEFPATGVRVEQAPASGGVRFTNCDFTRAYTIDKGAIVRTEADVRFATEEEVFLPVAILTGPFENPTLQCQSSEVLVTAVKPGTAGNVPAGAISVIPAGLNRNAIRVTNPAATTGGTRTEIPVVAQADVDAALTQLTSDLQDQFAAALVDPVGVPAGATVFPDTAVLGESRTDVDPATLVGQEVATFPLQMAADGTVLAVDEAPLQEIAEARLEGSVDEGHVLVEGSSVVEVGEATVVEGGITFPVTGYAQQYAPVDAAEIVPLVLGLPLEDAEAALEPYGDAEIVLWPDWVTSVPTLEQRVIVVVGAPVGAPLPTATPAPTASPSAEPSGDVPSAEPVPSP